MAGKKTPLLLMSLLEAPGVTRCRAAGGDLRREGVRRLGSCGALAGRRASVPFSPVTPFCTSSRSYINLAAAISNRRIEYTERRTLGYSPEQIYKVVARVDQYQHFVPWCKKSSMMKSRSGDIRAELEIGFAPILERYTSEVTLIPNNEVRALCTGGSLFSHLETIWRFSPGPLDLPDSCKVDFYVSFEFKSLLHSQLSIMFFDDVVKQMVSAFESRAATLYRNHKGMPVRRRSA